VQGAVLFMSVVQLAANMQSLIAGGLAPATPAAPRTCHIPRQTDQLAISTMLGGLPRARKAAGTAP